MRSGVSTVMAVAVLAGSAAGGILAVYGPRGTETEILKNSAEPLRREMGESPAAGAAGALTWRWTPGAVLGAEFSFGFEETAYFLTEKGVRFGSGFSAKGPAHFGAVPNASQPSIAPSVVGTEALKASRRGDRLLLGYPLSEAGRVSIDVYSLKGVRLAQWKGRREAGSHLQSVALPRRVAGEVLIVQLRLGDAVRVQRVHP